MINDRETKNISITVYKDQVDYIKKHKLVQSEAYRDAWDQKFRSGDLLLKEKSDILKRAEEIDFIINEEKNKPLSDQEKFFIKESQYLIAKSSINPMPRYEAFKKIFGRFHMSIEEFMDLVKQTK